MKRGDLVISLPPFIILDNLITDEMVVMEMIYQKS